MHVLAAQSVFHVGQVLNLAGVATGLHHFGVLKCQSLSHLKPFPPTKGKGRSGSQGLPLGLAGSLVLDLLVLHDLGIVLQLLHADPNFLGRTETDRHRVRSTRFETAMKLQVELIHGALVTCLPAFLGEWPRTSHAPQ